MSDNPKLLTPEERQAIAARAKAATGGKWEFRDDVIDARDEDGLSMLTIEADGPSIEELEDTYRFIAHSREDIPRLLRHVEALEVKLRDCSGAVDALLMLIDLEAPPDFGSNGIVGFGGGPDEGRVLTYELMNRCRDASKRAREVLK